MTEVGERRVLADARAEAHCIGAGIDCVQPRHVFKIDDKVRRGQPEGENGHQTLAARQQHGRVSPFTQDRHNLVEAGRRNIVKCGKFHYVTPGPRSLPP